MKKFLLTVISTLAFSNIAHGFWDVQNSEEDVFGNVNVTASSYGDNGNIIRFECGSSSDPFFVFLLRDNSGDIPELPASFLHVDQNKDRKISDAKLVSWNEKYVAVKVTDKDMLRRVAKHMLVAKKSIPVGVTIPNTTFKLADTFSSRGSTKAGTILLKHCFPE